MGAEKPPYFLFVMTKEDMNWLVSKGYAKWIDETSILIAKTNVVVRVRPDLPGIPVENKS
jgi:hypothetical protein